MSNVIDLALNKKYTQFSNEIKSTLMQKLNSNEYMQNYKNELNKINTIKSHFNKVTDFNRNGEHNEL